MSVIPPDVALPLSPDWVVLGLVCHVLAALFFLSSLGRGRPRHRLRQIFESGPTTLAVLRDAIHAKARGQTGAVFLLLGTGFLFASAWVVWESPFSLSFWGGGGLVALAVCLQLLLESHVIRAMRNAVKEHLQKHPFSFEDQISLTREIGDLFGVASSQEDTLEGYVRKVRTSLGITTPPSRLFSR